MDTWRNQLRLQEDACSDEDKISKLWRACYKATKHNCQHEYEKVFFIINEIVEQGRLYFGVYK